MNLRTRLAVPALCCALLFTAIAQQPTISPEWINKEGAHVADVAKYQWLEDGTAIFYDQRTPEPQRTLERFDPATGQKKTLFDGAKTFAALKQLGATFKKEIGLPWPDAIDSQGRHAAFEVEDKVFVVDMATGEAMRLGEGDAVVKSPQFSPNAAMVAFVRANDIYVYDFAAKIEKRITTDGSKTTLNGTLSWVYWEEVFGRRDIALWWSPDSKSIAFLQTDESQVPVSHFVDFKPQTPRLIEQPYPKPGQPNPKVRVGVTDVAQRQVRWVNLAQPYEWLLRVKWMPDASGFAVETMDRPQTHLLLAFVDRQTLAAKTVLTETDPAWVNVSEDLYFLKDGHFLWASERDGFFHLYRFKMDGTLVNKVTNGDWAMTASGGLMFWVRQGVTGVDEKNDWIYFTALKDGSTQRNLYRVKSDGSQFTRLSSEPGTHRIGMSLDCRYYFDTYSNIRTLPALRLHTSDGKQVSVLDAPRPRLLSAGFQFPTLMAIPAADGFQMPAQIVKPRSFDPKKKYPVIMHVYGGPSAPTVLDGWKSDLLFENLMANDGYIMVAVDNRVATGISKKLENAMYPNPGDSETADLAAAARWLKKQPYVDANRVGVWGWSGGGTNTLNLMTRTNEFKAGIAGAPVTDWMFYDSKWAEALVKLPQDNPEAYRHFSLVDRASDLSGHLMIIYGTYDDNVHPQNEQAFMNALIHAGKPFETKVYPMRKHGFEDVPAKIHRDATMREFWRRAL